MWMQPSTARVRTEWSEESEDGPLGEQLKSYFDGLTTSPVPDTLLRLTEALEAAFERGDLQCGKCRTSRA